MPVSRKRQSGRPSGASSILKFFKKRPKTEKQQLRENALGLEMKIMHDVPGDGSCFFHSIIAQFGKLGITRYDTRSSFEQAALLRRDAVQYLQDLDEASELMIQLKETGQLPNKVKLEKMKKHGEFAEQWIIQATAFFLQRDILVVSSKAPAGVRGPTSVLFQIDCQTPGHLEPFRVGHIVEGVHYMPLELEAVPAPAEPSMTTIDPQPTYASVLTSSPSPATGRKAPVSVSNATHGNATKSSAEPNIATVPAASSPSSPSRPQSPQTSSFLHSTTLPSTTNSTKKPTATTSNPNLMASASNSEPNVVFDSEDACATANKSSAPSSPTISPPLSSANVASSVSAPAPSTPLPTRKPTPTNCTTFSINPPSPPPSPHGHDPPSTPQSPSDGHVTSTTKSTSQVTNLHPNDLGNFSKPISEEDRLYLAQTGAFQPVANDLPRHQFPADEGNRKFSAKWYEDAQGNRRSWLTYSIKKNAMMCLPCFLFVSDNQTNTSGKGRPSKEWGEKGLQDWKKATGKDGKIKKHEESEIHKTSCQQMAMLLQSREKTIKEALNTAYSVAQEKKRKKIAANREILRRLLEIIILLAKQNIPFRGHRENGNDANRGNFLELVNHQQKYDAVLREHLKSAPKNAMYTHHDIQDELINMCADDVRRQVLSMFKKGYFCIVADETKDISNVEQMALVIRFFNQSNQSVEERTLNLVPLEAQDATSIANAIISELESNGLDIHKCRGQTYDGAAAMAGKHTGVQTQIREREPKAVFTHCHAHALNLAIIRSCSNTHIRNMYGTLDKLHIFFKGAKRNAVLERHKATSSKLSDTDKKRRLQSLSETRWASRKSAITSYLALSEVVGDALEELKTKRGMDAVTVNDATGLLASIASFDFIIAMLVARDILNITSTFVNYLQSPKINLLEFKNTAQIVFDDLSAMRNDNEFRTILNEAKEKARLDGFDVPERVKRSRRDVDGESLEDFYRRVLYFPTIDELLSGFKTRILGQNADLTSAFGVFSTQCLFHDNPNTSMHLETLSRIYGSEADPYPDIDASLLQPHYRQFKLWLKTKNLSSSDKDDINPVYLINLITDCQMETTFSTITTLLKIALTFALTSVSAERSFSELRLLKTYLRSTMTQQRLSSLLVINVNKDINIDLDEVIDAFARKHPRRLEFLFTE